MDNKTGSEKEAAKAMTQMAEELQKKEMSFNRYQCLVCEGHPQFEHVEMMKHIQEVHQIDPKATKFSRRMTMHLDGRDWYQSNYEWQHGDLVFAQYARNPRNKKTKLH
jgi:hypothetical protein